MSLTRPIPKTAMPIVEVLRRDVPRPKELPKCGDYVLHLLRWEKSYCPMGLHPRANSKAPYFNINDFPSYPKIRAIQRFANWWDDQTDPRAAMDAVWPRKAANCPEKTA